MSLKIQKDFTYELRIKNFKKQFQSSSEDLPALAFRQIKNVKTGSDL